MAADLTPELLAQLEVIASRNMPRFEHHVSDGITMAKAIPALVAAAKERDQLRVEVERLKEEVQASDMNMAAIMDGTFAVGDGTAQKEIERLRAEVERLRGLGLEAVNCAEDYRDYVCNSQEKAMAETKRLRAEIERKP